MDDYLFDVLMRDLAGHDRMPSAYLVLLTVWHAGQGKAVALSHGKIAELSGLSKRTVQNALKHLARRQLIRSEATGRTETLKHVPLMPWRPAHAKT